MPRISDREHLAFAAWLGPCVLAAAGCAAVGPLNPSIPITEDEAEAAIHEMEADPKPLARPIVILGGYLDPGLGPWWIARQLTKVISQGQGLQVQFFFAWDFDDCRTKLITEVDAAFPSDDPVWTSEVDVIALSMGGLAARHAAAPPADAASTPRRLKIARLFTISSPHRGARMAALSRLQPLHADMRHGSAFLTALDAAYREAEYELFAYVRLGDQIIGAENAAPAGENPWWLPNPRLEPAHLASATDVRILADIFRRLHGERPFATRPAAEVPAE
jgi:hypothetical protein